MADDLSWLRVQAYVQQLVPPRPDGLIQMEADAACERFPIIGPACGQLCYTLARATGARRVFELGSGFGYSTAWFARAVMENGGGEVFHVVWDETLSARARTHLDALGLGDTVQYRVGEAVEMLRQTDGTFDIVFVDIDKEGYPRSVPVVTHKLRIGGLLIVDNLLWHGRVWDEADRSEATEAVRSFTRAIFGDPRWSPSLVPIRDGLLVATKLR